MKSDDEIMRVERRVGVRGTVNTPMNGNKNLLQSPLTAHRRFSGSGKAHFWYHEATLIVALRRRGEKTLKEKQRTREEGGDCRRWGKERARMESRYNCYILLVTCHSRGSQLQERERSRDAAAPRRCSKVYTAVNSNVYTTTFFATA